MKFYDKHGDQYSIINIHISFLTNPYGNAIIKAVNIDGSIKVFTINKESDPLPEQQNIILIKRLLSKKPLKFKESLSEDIMQEVESIISELTGIPKIDIQAKNKKQEVVIARQLCMYYSLSLTKESLASIGRRFGNRDHATVLYARRQVPKMYNNPTFNGITELINSIEEKLGIRYLT